MNTAFFSIEGLTAAARVLAVLALAAVAAEGALTARVSNAPAEHRGKGKFTLSILSS